jgi:hypothetical protein
MKNHSTQRISFLLRLWRSNLDQDAEWRVSVENPMTGERNGFANLEALVDFLKSSANDRLLPGKEDQTQS